MHFKYLQKLCFGLQYYNSNLFDGFLLALLVPAASSVKTFGAGS